LAQDFDGISKLTLRSDGGVGGKALADQGSSKVQQAGTRLCEEVLGELLVLKRYVYKTTLQQRDRDRHVEFSLDRLLR
jgi:hypothetical protein